MESPFCPVGTLKDDADFRLIETFGFVPGRGVARWELHLARLASSAAHFGIVFDPMAIHRALEGVRAEGPLRCRLTLDAEGGVQISTAPMPQQASAWRFAISDIRLDAEDPFLRYKTTRRALYDQARATLPAGIDEMLFLNTRGELCEGTITNLVITTDDHQQLTPPLTSGCLPGVYRQSLLNAGQISQAVLTPKDLAKARSISLVNSLRGEIRAIWAPDCEEFASFA
ncbi:aminotransferase class IV family protein [Phaeobacter sp. 11ANDIMAR09]|uniref:aminotransferase class IV family protein n=1 Tax=Phaeobacter sp. 11ANDIMAR09 TaxID=1225647 RepID=UPI0006C8CF29|nr:aminotransferase class IV family protein [Phaeobacter sp. 11ANDIMAR09]KPD13782.1 4-amino-4-deoxychorismate lyase [Phaeobacter sp. 11ANDIMAR09]